MGHKKKADNQIHIQNIFENLQKTIRKTNPQKINKKYEQIIFIRGNGLTFAQVFGKEKFS